MKPYIVVILCLKRHLSALAQEYADWGADGAKVQHYGYTQKVTDGCIVLEWRKKIPERFVQKLYEDDDVIDFLLYDPNLQAVGLEQG
jgi:hypothetical protein